MVNKIEQKIVGYKVVDKSEKIKTGGPAFPFAYEEETTRYVSHGMTLRDYFSEWSDITW